MRTVASMLATAAVTMVVATATSAATVRSPSIAYRDLASNRPVHTDIGALAENYSYDGSNDGSTSWRSPTALADQIGVSTAQARRSFVGVVRRGLTDFFGDGPDLFVVARSHAEAVWYATTHRAGLDANATIDTQYNDPGTLLYDDAGEEVAVAVRGPVVVIAFAGASSPGYAEAYALLSIGLRYLSRVTG